MTADQEPAGSEWSIVNFAKEFVGLGHAEAAPEADVVEANGPPAVIEQLPDIARPESATPVADQATSGNKLRTPEEIAEMIMASLRAIAGCPEHGFVVTVYGSNPWNAMLTIRPQVGRIEREVWVSRVHELGVQLREHYDVTEPEPAETPHQ